MFGKLYVTYLDVEVAAISCCIDFCVKVVFYCGAEALLNLLRETTCTARQGTWARWIKTALM